MYQYHSNLFYIFWTHVDWELFGFLWWYGTGTSTATSTGNRPDIYYICQLHKAKAIVMFCLVPIGTYWFLPDHFSFIHFESIWIIPELVKERKRSREKLGIKRTSTKSHKILVRSNISPNGFLYFEDSIRILLAFFKIRVNSIKYRTWCSWNVVACFFLLGYSGCS